MYAQYGCGFLAPSQWLNFDSSPTLRIERLPVLGRFVQKNAQRFPANVRYGDIRKGPLTAPLSCDGIFASHVLEHLTRKEAEAALDNTLRMLKQGGTFRVVVPDLLAIAQRYVNAQAGEAAHQFMLETGLGRERPPRNLMDVLIATFGGSFHLWMWDERSLSEALARAGFIDIRRCQYGDSLDPMYRLVEQPHRFVDAVALESRRPNSA